VGDGSVPAQDPELTAFPVSRICQVAPVGFDGGIQVRVALVEVDDATDKVGAFSAPATASPYVPEPVAEK
jgi:hypothetical protein